MALCSITARMVSPPTVAMWFLLPATMAAISATMASIDNSGSSGSSRRTWGAKKRWASRPRPIGRMTICRMLSSIAATSTLIAASTYSRVSSGVATTPTSVDSEEMVTDSATSPRDR